jgi:Cys-rich protein (TIGR01571 family)
MESTGYKQSGDDFPLMINVEAPSTLPAGYTFEAYVNDDKMRPFTCEVPEGGVLEGQNFLVPLPEHDGIDRINAPTGMWKDGLCDCFSAGLCHASLWCACCCSRIGMAQIMTRMSLTWLGAPGQRVSTKDTFKVVVMLVVAYFIFSVSLEVASPGFDAEISVPIAVMKNLGALFFFWWSVYSLIKTRQSVRRQYSIPEERCIGCEDLCCTLWCGCCTVSQMARHTGEYENYPAPCYSTTCCSSTGHPKGAPLTV